jgi:hypothetical protein
MRFRLSRVWLWNPTLEDLTTKYPAIANYAPKVKKDGVYVTFSSLKKLKEFVDEIGEEIILAPDSDGLEIYDDYRE